MRCTVLEYGAVHHSDQALVQLKSYERSPIYSQHLLPSLSPTLDEDGDGGWSARPHIQSRNKHFVKFAKRRRYIIGYSAGGKASPLTDVHTHILVSSDLFFFPYSCLVKCGRKKKRRKRFHQVRESPVRGKGRPSEASSFSLAPRSLGGWGGGGGRDTMKFVCAEYAEFV